MHPQDSAMFRQIQYGRHRKSRKGKSRAQPATISFILWRMSQWVKSSTISFKMAVEDGMAKQAFYADVKVDRMAMFPSGWCVVDWIKSFSKSYEPINGGIFIAYQNLNWSLDYPAFQECLFPSRYFSISQEKIQYTHIYRVGSEDFFFPFFLFLLSHFLCGVT